MELFYGTDHIKKLSLSVRSSNALCRAGIFHIGDLLNLSEKDLYDLPRIGKASANEILCVCARLKFGEDCSYSDTGSVPSATAAQASESHPLSSDLCMSSVPCFVDSYGNLKRDIPVCKLALSRSAHSDLIKADIQYVSQLFGQYGDDIPDNHKIRSRTMAEIRSILADTTYERLSPQEVYGWRYEAHDLAMAIIGNLSEASCVPTRFIYGIILALCLEYIGLHPAAVPAEALEDDRFIQQIYILPPIYNLLLQHMQNVVDATDFGVSDKALAEKMPRHFQDSELVAHLIESAISRSAITRNKDGLLERKYPTILEYVDSIPSVRSRAIVLGRLQGKSFRALGAEYGLTPERIRQVLEKAMRNHPKVAEDRYAKIFQTYSIQKEDFIRAFQESEICYQYLKITYKAGRQPPEALIVNNAFPPFIRRAAGKCCKNQQLLQVGDACIPATKMGIVKHLAQKYCQDETTFNTFWKIYQSFLSEHGLENRAACTTTEKSLIKMLASCNFLLWAYGTSFRYYDFDGRNFADFLSSLDLSKYMNLELSTLKLFRNCPQLMEAFDIRNEYELHSLLRKILPSYPHLHVTMLKMPTIRIGKGSRSRQMQELLQERAPISAKDLSEEFERLYGFKAESVSVAARARSSDNFHGE